MEKVTIVLADDHRLVHEGLRALLEAEPGFTVLGEVNDGLEAIRLTERLQPDVLLVDLAMPNLSGLEVTRQVKKRFPHIHVIVLSMHTNEAYVLEALRNGASGYILKESSVTETIREYVRSPAASVSSAGRYPSKGLMLISKRPKLVCGTLMIRSPPENARYSR